MGSILNSVKLSLFKPRWIKKPLRKLQVLGSAYVKSAGIKYYFDLGDLSGPSYHLNHWGVTTYEPASQKLLADLLSEGGVFLDVGANIGIFSLLAASLHSRVQVFSFEPDPQALSCLKRSVVENKLERICVVAKGVSDRSGDGTIFFDQRNHGGHSMILESIAAEGRSEQHRAQIELITLDSFVGQNDLPAVDVIKIDVQEHESAVLRGSFEIVKKFQPIVIVECNVSTGEDVFNFFKELNYSAYNIVDAAELSVDDAKMELASGARGYIDYAFFPEGKSLSSFKSPPRAAL